MKRWFSVLTFSSASALGIAVLSGCGGSRPPPAAPAELQGARAAYQRAESGPAAKYDQSGLIEARQALDAAEREFADEPESEDVKTLGYVAERKAKIAQADGRAAAALQASAGRSERRARVALDRLGLAVEDEARGTVITIPSATMFATNEAKILPAAKAHLTDIAKALEQVVIEGAPQDVGRKIVLVGYTDDTGSDEYNLELSQRRADAVRVFFSQHGLDDAAMLDTKGRGEAEPVASNDTAEGRAKNRRVEIVITPLGGGAPSAGGASK